MFPPINALAKQITADWARAHWDEGALCDIACEHLARPLDLDFEGLAGRIFSGAVLPEQRRLDEGFGQPAITLYTGERLQIEALCWHSGTPAIHQHAFSGAFRILTGHSVQSRYSFTPHDEVERVVLGELRLESVEHLDTGAVVPIPRGNAFIHAAFHLDSPSMTLVVRTPQGREPEPTYLPPGVAYDTAQRSPALHKRLQLLDTLSRTEHPAYLDSVHAALEHGDLYERMAIVMRVAGHPVDEEAFVRVTQRLDAVYGSRIAPLLAALVEERRRSLIVRLRASIKDSETRFLLAILMSFSNRAHVIRALSERYGDLRTVHERIAIGITKLLGGDGPRQLVTSTLAKAMLEGVHPDEVCVWAARTWNRSLSAAEAQGLERYFRQMLHHPVLAPLAGEYHGVRS